MVKFTNYIAIVAALLLGVHAFDQDLAKKIKQELVEAKIIPEAIDDFDILTELKITYDESNSLSNGKNIRPEQTLVVPSVWFEPPSKNSEYTLAMVNLDSHGPLVRHWIATNVNGEENEQGNAFLSQLPRHRYTSYKGPTPPSGSATHRVAFILFQQGVKNHTFTPDVDSTSLRNRAFFDLKQFALDNQLTPISAAYYLTEYQEGFSQKYPPNAIEKLSLDSKQQVKEADFAYDLVDDVGNVVESIIVEDAYDDYSYTYSYTYDYDYGYGDTTPDPQDIYDIIFDDIYSDIQHNVGNKHTYPYTTTVNDRIRPRPTISVGRNTVNNRNKPITTVTFGRNTFSNRNRPRPTITIDRDIFDNRNRPGRTVTRTLTQVIGKPTITESPRKTRVGAVDSILDLVGSVVDGLLGITINIGPAHQSADDDENDDTEGVVISLNSANGTVNRIEIKQNGELDEANKQELVKVLKEIVNATKAESVLEHPVNNASIYDQVSLLAKTSVVNSGDK